MVWSKQAEQGSIGELETVVLRKQRTVWKKIKRFKIYTNYYKIWNILLNDKLYICRGKLHEARQTTNRVLTVLTSHELRDLNEYLRNAVE